MLVDRQSQKPATGKLTLFECESDYTVVAARCDGAYPGVEHTRWLVVAGTYMLVFDTLRSDVEHRFDWTYHNRGDKVVCDVARSNVNLEDKYPGGEHIQNCRQGTTSEMIFVRFENPNVTTYLTVAAQEDTEVAIGEGVGASITDRVPMTLFGRDGRKTHFAAVLEPVVSGKRPRVTGVRYNETDEGLTIVVEYGGQTDSVRIFPDNRVLVDLSHQTAQ